MKLKKLTIHNLASLEDAELNFDNNPLSAARLFLICGDTGSGKSTLLDAICLALYGDTPRLNRANNKKKEYGKDTISAQDPRNLMRHGATDASVELAFEGNDGRHYQADWSVRRTRNHTLDTVKRTLTVEGVAVDKKEMDELLNVAVGLDFDEFCRTTMLAQGQFTQFLKSSENEKAEILEKMTNTSQFSSIGKMIFTLFTAAKDEHEREKMKADAVQLLSDEEVEIKRQQLEEKKQDEKQLQKKHEETDKKVLWIETDQKNLAAWTLKEEEFKQIKNIVEDPQFQTEEKILTDWDRSAEARAWKKTQWEVEQKVKTIEEEKEPRARRIFAELVAAQEAFGQKVASDSVLLKEKREILATETIHETMYEKEQTIRAKLGEVATNRAENEKDRTAVDMLEKKLPELEDEVEKRRTALKLAMEAVEAKRLEKEQAERVLANLKPEELNRQRAQLDDRQKHIAAALKALTNLESCQNSLEVAKSTVDGANEKIRKAMADKESNSTILAERQRAYKDTKAAYDNATLAIGDDVARLRAQLKAGDNCPVCGQKIDQLLSDEAVRQALEPLKTDLEKKEKEFQEVQAKIKAAELIIKENERDLPKWQKQLDAVEKEFSAKWQAAQEACNQLSLSLPNAEKETLATMEPSLQALQHQVEQERGALATRQTEVDRQNNAIKALGGGHTDLLKKQNEVQTALTNAENTVKEQKGKIEQKREAVRGREDKVAEILREVDDFMTIPSWREFWTADEPKFTAELSAKAKVFKALKEAIRQLEETERSGAELLEKMSKNREEVLKQWPDWTAGAVDPSTISTDDLENRWNDFAKNANTLFTKKEEFLNQRRGLQENLTKFYADHLEMDETRLLELMNCSGVEDVKKRHQEVKANFQTAEGGLKQLQETYEKHHSSEHPELLAEETLEMLKRQSVEESERLGRLNQEMGGLEGELKRDGAARKQQQTLLDSVKRLEEKRLKWSKLNDCFGGSDGAKFRNIAQSYLLENLLRAANLYLADLNKRYTLECISGTLTISLRDQYQPDMVSPVDTLSGGESFLVSLSLALALASMSRQGLSIDTLFIDEGFGTLSDNELDTVMTLLERMQERKGKRVGIISHVKELRERIPVHVEVKRLDPTRSGIRVVDVTAAR